jgi:uncharacterized protein YecE (DUF72 family)
VTGWDDYNLGLPAWAFPGWRDRYFTDKPSRLASYAQVFNTVEGNTTFYSVPGAETVDRWRASVLGRDFRFCFKPPRGVTHERRPQLDELARFLRAIAPLGRAVGPLLVQFPATVGPGDIQRFEPVFESLAGAHRFVIEVRHTAFFDDPALLESTLERYTAGRVVLDARPLYEGDRAHPEVLAALHEKPDVAVRPAVRNGLAFIRLVLHPDVGSNRRYIDQWAGRVADYLATGTETYVMIHCPNNLHCPPLALEFHRALANRPGMRSLGDLPRWPLSEQLTLV